MKDLYRSAPVNNLFFSFPGPILCTGIPLNMCDIKNRKAIFGKNNLGLENAGSSLARVSNTVFNTLSSNSLSNVISSYSMCVLQYYNLINKWQEEAATEYRAVCVDVCASGQSASLVCHTHTHTPPRSTILIVLHSRPEGWQLYQQQQQPGNLDIKRGRREERKKSVFCLSLSLCVFLLPLDRLDNQGNLLSDNKKGKPFDVYSRWQCVYVCVCVCV